MRTLIHILSILRLYLYLRGDHRGRDQLTQVTEELGLGLLATEVHYFSEKSFIILLLGHQIQRGGYLTALICLSWCFLIPGLAQSGVSCVLNAWGGLSYENSLLLSACLQFFKLQSKGLPLQPYLCTLYSPTPFT